MTIDRDQGSIFEQLDAMNEAFEQGLSYRMRVTSSSMEPMLKAHRTVMTLVPVSDKHPLRYGSLILFSRVSKSVSLRWMVLERETSVDVRALSRRRIERRIPKNSVLAIVSEYETDGKVIRTDSLEYHVIAFFWWMASILIRLGKTLRERLSFD